MWARVCQARHATWIVRRREAGRRPAPGDVRRVGGRACASLTTRADDARCKRVATTRKAVSRGIWPAKAAYLRLERGGAWRVDWPRRSSRGHLLELAWEWKP
eukprot:scaffold296899_cov21-Tisochrysis_lutea.AAC.2